MVWKPPVSRPLACCLLLLAASSAMAKEHKVSISDVKFAPKELKVKTGDTVVWTNSDDRDHTVTADDDGFASGNLRSGKSFSHKFEKAGKFKYHCNYHPRMKGMVVVED